MLGLNALLEVFSGKKVAVLGFPCNQFGLQDPCKPEETLNAYKYVRPGNGWEPHQKFLILKKIEVNGKGEHPLFTFLKANVAPPSDIIGDKAKLFWDPIKVTDITWNFEKFVVDKAGKPRFRFSPRTDVESLTTCIDELLQE